MREKLGVACTRENTSANFHHSIETWALEEAKRRLQAEGTLPEDK